MLWFKSGRIKTGDILIFLEPDFKKGRKNRLKSWVLFCLHYQFKQDIYNKSFFALLDIGNF